MTDTRQPTSQAFQLHSDDVLASIEAGASAADAARNATIAPRTVERWLARGREEPDGPYGEFAQAVDALRDERALDAAKGLDEAELELLAASAARKGSVAAMRLVWNILRARDSKSSTGDDPLAALDELAARRAAKARGAGS